MAKHKIKIGTQVRVKVGYRTTDPREMKVVEDDAVGEIIDLHAWDDEKYYVLFDGFLTEEGTDLCIWLTSDQFKTI